MSGNSGERAVELRASPVNCPLLTWPIMLASPRNTIGVVLAMTALTISLPLRNGTRTMSMPFFLFNWSMK